MNNRFYTAVSAAALSLSLMTGAVFAQDDLGLKQLQDSAISAMAKLNMDTSMVDMLTLDELAAESRPRPTAPPRTPRKVGRINEILTTAEERIAAGGAVVPQGATGDITNEDLAGDQVVKANVGVFIAQLGLNDRIDVDTLTTDELLQLQLIQQGDDGDAEHRMRVEKLLLD